MNKSLILSRIKEYYNFKNDTTFAKHLGVSSQVLSNWKNRNTYDPELIYTKCLEINPEWLLTGEGNMLQNPDKQEIPTTQVITNHKELEVVQKKLITIQEKEIARLERKNKKLIKKIEGLTKKK